MLNGPKAPVQITPNLLSLAKGTDKLNTIVNPNAPKVPTKSTSNLAGLAKGVDKLNTIPSLNQSSGLDSGYLSKGNVGSSGFGSSVGNFLKSDLGGAAVGAISSISSMIPSADKDINSTDAIVGNMRGSVNSALMKSGNPYAMAAGAINTVIDKTGGYTDASKGLGAGTDTLNSIAALAIPGAGWFTGKTDKFAVDEKLSNSSGFTGSADYAKTVAGNAGAKLLFGKNKANSMIADAKRVQNQIVDTLDFNGTLLQSQAGNAQSIQAGSDFTKNGGWNQGAVMFGKNGMKVKDLSSIKRIARNTKNSKKLNSYELIECHAKGGVLKASSSTISKDMNVIPSGALHAHKHNLNEVDKDLSKQITHKGVPVISKAMGDEIDQLAEIERGEIIFRKEVTEKLEELWKKGTDQAMIEAGKLISDEILNNTIDNSEEYGIEDKK